MPEKPTIAETITEMLSTEYFRRFNKGDNVPEEQHIKVFYETASASSANVAAEYLRLTRGVSVSAGALAAAVRRGELTAYKIGNSLHFAPVDLDTWLESRKVGA